MKKYLFDGDEDMNVRKDNLDALAFRVTADEKYDRPLTEEEVTARREQREAIENEQEDVMLAKKEAMEGFKLTLTGLAKASAQLRQEIRSKSVRESGRQWLIDDQEAGLMGYYNERGELIKTRKLLPDEKQRPTLRLSRTGTDE